MTVRPETLAAVEEALREGKGFPYAGTRLAEGAPSQSGDEVAPFVAALGYHFIEHSHDQMRERAEEAFGAAIEVDNKRFPPTIESLPESILLEWNEAAEATSNAALRARLHDLLWVARYGERRDLHARKAADAYLEVASDPEWHSMDRVDCLSRSLELARMVGDIERMTAAESAMKERIQSSLSAEPDSEQAGPGVSLTLLRGLSDLGRMDGDELDGLLLQAFERFAGDPRIRESIVDLREPLVDASQRPELRRAQVQEWRQLANQDGGLARVVHLEHALEISRLHRLVDEETELLREMQEISDEDLDLKEISAEIQIPRAKLETFHESFIDTENRWQVSLVRFGNYGPPGGTQEDVDEQVAQKMQQSPIQFHVPKVVFGPDNTTIFRAIDEASHHHLAKAQERAFASHIWSLSAVSVLNLIRDRHGKPDEGDVAEFFTTELIPADLASRIARCFDLYWEGKFDEAGHMLAPRLERLVRELARRAGIPIIKPPDPQALRPGGVRTLGDLLRALEGVFAEDAWRLHLHNLLADPLGLNLRNSVAHDLQPQVEAEQVALMLHAACFLRLLGTRPAT